MTNLLKTYTVTVIPKPYTFTVHAENERQAERIGHLKYESSLRDIEDVTAEEVV